jgi:filamentous hemagglutinin family protein
MEKMVLLYFCKCQVFLIKRNMGRIKLLSMLLIVLGNLIFSYVVRAQATPDNSLGNERSVVLPSGEPFIDLIRGGAIRGSNLFHSFQEFNVNAGTSVYFENPTEIQNILTRVTGNNPSRILGVLGVLGNANLFLMNPKGIIFGSEASLDLRGSFVASTASEFFFGGESKFSTIDPQTALLLAVNIPIGLNFRQPPGKISVDGLGVLGSLLGFTLNVSPGKTIALLGGDVEINAGVLSASGGQVQLGGVAAGTVELQANGNNLSFNFPQNLQRADVKLVNGSIVDVNASSGGSIAITSRNFDLLGRSGIFAGIGDGLGTEGSQAGDITLNATGAVNIENSLVFNEVGDRSIGNAGNLTVDAKQVSIRDGGQVRTASFGKGNTGNLLIRAAQVDIFETSTYNGSITGVFNSVASNGIGNALNLTIEAERLSIRDGAQVTANTFGRGNAANVLLQASESVEVTGSSGRRPTFLVADVYPRAIGQGGNLTIETKRLSIRDGAQVATSTFSSTNAGRITVKASESVEVIGKSADGRATSGLFSQAEPQSSGKGGSLTIDTPQLTIRQDARVSTATFGTGDAGDLKIVAGRLLIREQGEISASTDKTGNAGNLTINASEIDLSGTSANASNSSSIRAQVNNEATGNGGTLTIETGRLILQDGAKVSSSAQGEGRGGNLTITASDSVEVIGRSPNGRTTPSAIFARTEGRTERAGDGGDLAITTGRLNVRDGGQVSASTFGIGNAGDLTIRASESVELTGTSPFGRFPSGLFAQSNTGAQGNGGNLTIDTKQLIVQGGSQVSAATLGSSVGQGGNLTAIASEFVEVTGTSPSSFPSRILTQTDNDGNAGNLTINTKVLSVRNGATVSTATTEGKGRGGILTVLASDGVEVSGESADGELASLLSTESLSSGNAGDLRIRSGQLSIRDGASISTRSSETGIAGNIDITANDIRLTNQSTINAQAASQDGGNIKLQVPDLVLLRQGSQISTTAGTNFGPGDGGNIDINTGFLVALPGENSDVTANSFGGRGGAINITTQGIFGLSVRSQLTPLSDITAFSQLSPTLNGEITLNTPEVDPSQGLVELPQTIIDPDALVGW